MNFGEPLAVLAILCVFLGIGVGWERLFASGDRVAPVFQLVSGWAFLSALGVFAALGHFSVTAISILTGVIGSGAFLLFALTRGDFRRALACGVIALLLLLPLLWFAAGTPATIFDEFGQWLPNARFLYEHGHFPSAADPNIWSYKPGYPPAMPLVIAAGSLLAHGFGETIGKLLVIALGAGFGIVLADLLSARLGRWPALVAGVALATILNPFFDPRISLTVYADTPTGFVLALTIFAAWRALNGPDAVWLWRAGTGAILLVLLRETNVVLIAGLCFGLAALIARKQARAIRLAAVIAFSTAIPLLAWRIYLHTAEIQPAMVVRHIDAWDWHAPVTVLRVLLLDRLSGNPLIGGVAVLCLGVVIFAAWRLIRQTGRELGLLLILLSGTAVTWLAFLTFSYIAVFSPPEVAHASSVWRYVGQLGPSLLLTLAAILGKGSAPHAVKRQGKALACGAALLLVIFQVATWKYWRVDCRYADVVSVRQIARSLSASVSIGDAPLTVVNPVEGPAYAVQLDYDLHRPAERSHAVGAVDEAREDGLILDLTPVDRLAAYAARLSPAVSLLRRQDGMLSPVIVVPAQPIEGACHAF